MTGRIGGLSRTRITAIGVAAATLLIAATLVAEPSYAASSDGAADAPIGAIEAVDPGAISAGVRAQATTGIVPVSPTAAVTLTAQDPRAGVYQGSSVVVGLPFASTAVAGRGSSGLLAYDNGNGSSTVPLSQADGSVQITTVIANRSAPSNYTYRLTLPQGVALVSAPDGGAILQASSGPVGAIAAPWAKDANGVAVPTHYVISGNTLTQVVDLSAPGIAFPVVADPTISFLGWGYAVKYSKTETKQIATQTAATDVSTLCGLIGNRVVVAFCLAIVNAVIGNALTTAIRAARDGRCLQINYPVAIPYEVTC